MAPDCGRRLAHRRASARGVLALHRGAVAGRRSARRPRLPSPVRRREPCRPRGEPADQRRSRNHEVRRGVRARTARSPPAGVGAAGPHGNQRGASGPAGRTELAGRAGTGLGAEHLRLPASEVSRPPYPGARRLQPGRRRRVAAAGKRNRRQGADQRPRAAVMADARFAVDRLPRVPQRRDDRRRTRAVHGAGAAVDPAWPPRLRRDAGFRGDGGRPRVLLRVLSRAARRRTRRCRRQSRTPAADRRSTDRQLVDSGAVFAPARRPALVRRSDPAGDRQLR